jgi:transcriptional regulator with XRE-family HTH domain
MPSSKRESKPESFDKAWRAELKRLRTAKGWSQGTLGATAGYGQNYISNVERGIQMPRFGVVFDLVETLGQRPDLFMSAVWKRTQRTPPGSDKAEKAAKPSRDAQPIKTPKRSSSASKRQAK